MAAPSALRDDPDIKIPAAVRAQTERTNAIIRQLQGDPPQGEQPVVDPALDPANLAAPAQEPEPAPQQSAEPAPQQSQDPADETSWEHKYKSIHGRYMSLKEQNASLLLRVSNMENVIAAMQTAAPPPTQRAPAELQAESLLTPEERNDYGTDMLNVVGKRAREELNPLIAQQQQRIDQLETVLRGVVGNVAMTAQEQMLATLDKELPEWRDVNRKDEFLEWLALPDAFSGAIRHNMLKEAYAQSNAPRVLAFFNGYLKEVAAMTPTRVQEPVPGETRVAKIPLETLAAPGKAKAAPNAPAAPDKPIITRAQIANFYADVAANRYRGRDVEKAATEQAIFLAQNDGRIRD